MCDVHGNAHVCKVKPVAQPDQADGNDVMRHQLLEVFPRLFQHQHQHNGLLRPVAGLEKIVCLDNRLVRPVGEALVHANRVEVPHGRARHDPYAKGAVDAKVEGRVRLLHEAGLLVAVFDAKVYSNGANQPLHAVFSREAQHNGVEAHKGKVPSTFSIVQRRVGVGPHVGGDEGVVACEGIREEETGRKGIRGVGIDEVQQDGRGGEDEGEQPCVPYARALELGKVAACRLAF